MTTSVTLVAALRITTLLRVAGKFVPEAVQVDALAAGDEALGVRAAEQQFGNAEQTGSTDMKLEGIATFVTVAESGSLSEAARRLCVSRSVQEI